VGNCRDGGALRRCDDRRIRRSGRKRRQRHRTQPRLGRQRGRPGEAARDIAGAGHNLDTTASWLAWLLALAVASPPILALVMPWLFLRIRFLRRKWTAITLAGTPAGEQLLALRALANRPLGKLAAISADPVGAWRSYDAVAIRGLAALELRSAGVQRLRR
jgi:hypothetical protein